MTRLLGLAAGANPAFGLSAAAVTAAERMPTARRRAAHASITEQLDGIDADLMARLGVG